VSYRKILVWEVNWIGDVLFTTPFLRALRNRFPESYIACIAAPRCQGILEANPNINEVIVYDEKNLNKAFTDKISLIIKLRKEKFDVVFLLHRSLTKAIICFFAGIRQRIGYSYKKRNFLLTQKARNYSIDVHKIDYFLGLAKKIGADVKNTALEFYTKPEDEHYIDQFLLNNKILPSDKIVILNPGGNWDPKRWPAENYAKLTEELIKKMGVKIIVTGAEKDLDLYLKIQENIKEPIISVTGRTTIRQLGALFKRAALVISGDSGPMHVALAVRAKVIAIFGPTSPALTGPYGPGRYKILQKDVGCIVPCYNQECKSLRCMKAVEVEDVLREAILMLKQQV